MIRPINEYVVLKPINEEKRIGKLIVVQENEKKKTNIGEVIAVAKIENENIKINVGDRIIYRDYAVSEYVEDNEKYLLVQAEDILAVL